MSESDDYDYAYSSDEDGGGGTMEWEASDNPNAAPMNYAKTPPDSLVTRGRSGSLSGSGSGGACKSGIRMMAAEDVRPEMTRRLRDVVEVLGVGMAAAAVLLRQHNWSKEELLERYMSDPDKVLQEAGVYHRCGHVVQPAHEVEQEQDAGSKNKKKKKKMVTCPICYDDTDTMLAMPCGHAFCYDCWYDFCTNAIEQEGPGCVTTTCPQAGCKEIVTQDEVALSLGDAAPKLLEKFCAFELRSFVESNPLTRWCPGAGCERVACALSHAMMESEGKVAQCDLCTHRFCLVCGEEPHAPASCKDLALWSEKCRNESETANWILANTKSCPKCVSRIEKNQGCNHMTCQRCKFEFCWICMGDWKNHGANTGGYYKCSRYNDPTGSGMGGTGGPEDQSDSARAKRDLDRYLHYYRRYHAHQEAEKFAMRQLQETEQRMILLQESTAEAKWSDVEFLKTANEQLVECRRVLKYTYVFSYYLDAPNGSLNNNSQSNNNNTNMHQRERFEHHQEMLERFTENLSELSEKPIAEMDRTDVVNQTRVVDRFMKNILKYVDEGMEE